MQMLLIAMSKWLDVKALVLALSMVGVFIYSAVTACFPEVFPGGYKLFSFVPLVVITLKIQHSMELREDPYLLDSFVKIIVCGLLNMTCFGLGFWVGNILREVVT